MAKIGAQDQGDYDPFTAISESLSDLSAPSAVQAPAPKSAQSSKKQTLPLPPQPKPVEVQAPQPAPAIQPEVAESGGGAIEPVPQPKPVAKTVSKKSALQITKRFKTTRQEGQEIEAAAMHLGSALGVSVDFSKLTRALWDVYLRHQDDILRNVPEGESWQRPANNDAAGLAELDERIANLINDGLMVACRRPTNSR